MGADKKNASNQSGGSFDRCPNCGYCPSCGQANPVLPNRPYYTPVYDTPTVAPTVWYNSGYGNITYAG